MIYRFKMCNFIVLLCAMSCQNNINPIEKALQSNHPKIQNVVKNLKKHEVQILFTEVLTANDTTIFKDYSYNVNDKNYFYPASTVKFPIALLALEKMNKNDLINLHTPFSVSGDSIKTTCAKVIEKIFAVSDNAAFNRLYDYLGKDYVNKTLEQKGIIARISHKLETSNQKSREVSFFKNDSVIFKSLASENTPVKTINLNRLKKGIGYTVGDSLVNAPMDFSKKNYLPLTALHSMMKRIIYPELFPKNERFHLLKSDADFLMKTMKILPREAGYTTDEYYDGYVKFFVFGDTKEPIPNHIEIYNKVGYAYGYLTDCAYILNKRTNKRYFITATIHVNDNRIYNDNIYEYETIGIPFLAELGRALTGIY